MTLTGQQELDYTQAAQQRIAAETRALERTATLTVLGGSDSVALPVDVIEILGLNAADTTEYPLLLTEDWLATRSRGATLVGPGYLVLGQTLYVTPTPALDAVFVITYTARPGELDSDSDLELDRPYERLVEWRVLGDVMRDERQDELATYYDDIIALRAGQLRRETRREAPDRLRHAAYDS